MLGLGHLCHEEVFAAFEAVKGLRMAVPWMRAKWHDWRKCPHVQCTCGGIAHGACSFWCDTMKDAKPAIRRLEKPVAQNRTGE